MPFDFRKLHGRGYFPARLHALLPREVKRRGSNERLFAFNAHYGPGRATWDCEDCAYRPDGPMDAAKHAAELGHICQRKFVQTIVPHCVEDAPEFWPDAGFHP